MFAFSKKGKFNASPSWACQFCYQPTIKPETKKHRPCPNCDEGKDHPQAVQYWDSEAELRRWAELKLLERHGHIQNLQAKPKFPILFENKPLKTLRSYEADFAYFKGNERIIEDMKGVRTHIYKIKKELVELMYPGTKILETKAR